MPLAVGSIVGRRGAACVCGEREKVGASASSEPGVSAFIARASGGVDVGIRRLRRISARRRGALLHFHR